MKLVNINPDDDLAYILKEDIEADYIEAKWMNIKNDQNEKIGSITGYRLNIPLITNDILINTGHSCYELDSISELCSELWCLLEDNIEMFKGKSGELLFLNRLELNEPNEDKYNEILNKLKDKYEFIVYSLGTTELFDDFNREWPEGEYDRLKQNILNTGWMLNEKYGFFLYENVNLTKKTEYKESGNQQGDFKTPFEEWVKYQGVNWLESFWKGMLRQSHVRSHLEKITFLEKVNQEEYLQEGFIEATKFLKKFKIQDFKQFDPEGEYIGIAQSHAKELRSEALYVTYNRKKYMISLNQDLLDFDDEVMSFISFGTFDKENNIYCIGCEELFDVTVDSWVTAIVQELFDRVYNQYITEIRNQYSLFPQESLFKMASRGPLLIERRK
jgi:hypothetical protein